MLNDSTSGFTNGCRKSWEWLCIATAWLFVLFDFREFSEEVYRDIVRSFECQQTISDNGALLEVKEAQAVQVV